MQFIAFDLETTGTVPGIDSIVEIGAVKFIDGRVDAVYTTLVNPRKPMPLAASRVNGITDEMLVGKPYIENLLESFTEFCQSFPLIAHNASFDSQFLLADYKKYEISTPSGMILDTLPISRKILPGLPNYKLGTLIQHLNIPSSEFHRAEADAVYVGKLFCELTKRVFTGNSVIKIENLIALTGKPEYKLPEIKRQPKQLNFFT